MRSLHDACHSIKHPAASTASFLLCSFALSALSGPEVRSISRVRLLDMSRSASDDAAAGPGLPRLCPTSRTPRSSVLPGFFRIHTSSELQVRLLADENLPLSSTIVVLTASVPASVGCCTGPNLDRGRRLPLHCAPAVDLTCPRNPAAVPRL